MEMKKRLKNFSEGHSNNLFFLSKNNYFVINNNFLHKFLYAILLLLLSKACLLDSYFEGVFLEF